MKFAWNESKRIENLRSHGLDFVDVACVFTGAIISKEDQRFAYTERRYCSTGMLAGQVVIIIHTLTAEEIHVISFRKANRRESRNYIREVLKQNGLGPSPCNGRRRHHL
ncbi:BrnT family toxin [Pseudoduganella sp. OTU4001]|uniref:BrnT family toxin n=1 Tax=Pseudoduganella sp. OTU4001 TaxID=3043854 RepID=UPI00406C72D8